MIPVLLWQNFTGTKKRTGWAARLFGHLPADLELPKPDSQVLWIHGVSVGEINLLSTLYGPLQEAIPGCKIYVSSSTDSGLELAKTKFPEGSVFRCPWDFSWAIRNVFKKLKPSAVILGELEIWPNWVAKAKKESVPVFVVNGRLSHSSHHGYRRLSFLTGPIFQGLELVCCQTNPYAQRFSSLGVPKKDVLVTGSMKFDAANVERGVPQKAIQFQNLVSIDENDFVFLAGSTSDPEEQMVIQSFFELKESAPEARLILVPRHPERFEQVAILCRKATEKFVRRSLVCGKGDVPAEWEILLVDTVGELRDWWSLASVGFVGGSMGKRGGQSMIEPASIGVPCCFGPNTSNFKDVVDMLLSKKAAEVVQGKDSLTQFLIQLYLDKSKANEMGEAARKLAKSQTGATLKTVQAIAKRLSAKVSS